MKYSEQQARHTDMRDTLRNLKIRDNTYFLSFQRVESTKPCTFPFSPQQTNPVLISFSSPSKKTNLWTMLWQERWRHWRIWTQTWFCFILINFITRFFFQRWDLRCVRLENKLNESVCVCVCVFIYICRFILNNTGTLQLWGEPRVDPSGRGK